MVFGKTHFETTKKLLHTLQSRNISKYTMLQWFLWIIAVLIIVMIYFYYRRQLTKEDSDLQTMDSTLATIPITLRSVNASDGQYQYRLRDYYIASSYNSCCPGNFLDDYVSLEALTKVISRGARLLDFEIYSFQDKAVVAASPRPSFYFKGTYNSIPIDEVFDTIQRYAFSTPCPNPGDPLFIHLRVKTNHVDIYGEIAKSLTSNFKNLLSQVNSEYAYEAHGENITSELFKHFIGKVMIICDNRNNNFRNTPLEELINVTSSSIFMRGLRNYDVQYTPDMNTLIEYNKKQISLTMPDESELNVNPPAALHQKYGCQMVCMNYQNLDANLKYYLDFFSSSAFVLKPKSLRYVPVSYKPPPPQDPQLSYAPRTINMPQFQGNI